MCILLLLLLSLMPHPSHSQYVLPPSGVSDFVATSASLVSYDPSDPSIINWDYFRNAENAYCGSETLMTDFDRIHFWVASVNFATTLAMMITDAEGTEFLWSMSIGPAGENEWVWVDLSPSNFTPAGLDSSRIRQGLALFDLDGIFGGDSQHNQIRFRDYQVEFAPFDLVVGETTIVSTDVVVIQDSSLLVDGKLDIYGKLIFENSSRIYVNGDIYLHGGLAELVLNDAVMIIPQSYPYHMRLDLWHGSKWIVSNSTFVFFQPYDVASLNATTVDFSYVNFYSGLITFGITGEFPSWGIPGSLLRMDHFEGFTEFCMFPGTQLDVDFGTELLLWHIFDDTIASTLTFPGGDVDYVSDAAVPQDVTVTNSVDIMYSIIVQTGCVATIDGSSMRAVGVWFDGSSDVVVTDFHNGDLVDDLHIDDGGIDLRLTNTLVTTWNFYTQQVEKSPVNPTVLEITFSLFGEIISQGYSKMIARNSTCDGSGGYLGSRDHSELTAWWMDISSAVIVHDFSTIRLYGCIARYDIIVESGATLYLNGTTHYGNLVTFPGATVYYGELILPDGLPSDPEDTGGLDPSVLAAIIGGSTSAALLVLVFLVVVVVVIVVVCCRKKKGRTRRHDVEMETGV